MRDLLFSELINFMDKIIQENPELLFKPRKDSESSKNSTIILKEIMEYEEPK